MRRACLFQECALYQLCPDFRPSRDHFPTLLATQQSVQSDQNIMLKVRASPDQRLRARAPRRSEKAGVHTVRIIWRKTHQAVQAHQLPL